MPSRYTGPMKSTLVVFTGLGALALAWGAFILIDLADVFGLGTAVYEHLSARDSSRFQVWAILFTEGGPIEILQWLFLAAASGFALHTHGVLSAEGNPERTTNRARLFWLLMGIAFLLMLIEDAGNPRHWAIRFSQMLFGGNAGQVTELAYFVSLGSLPLIALALFWRTILTLPRTRVFLLGGFVVYGIAAISSASRYYWYEAAGHWLHVSVFGERLREVSLGNHGHGFWLMDYLMEESFELAGATLLAAAAAAFLREYKELFRQ